MAELLVVGFQDNIHRASGVLDELRVLDDEWILELADAVAVHREMDGTLAMDQNYQPTGRGATEWGATIGFLVGATLSIPFTTGASPDVALGAKIAANLATSQTGGVNVSVRASLSKNLSSILEEFFERARPLLRPGNSAIYAMLETSDSTIAPARFQRYGGAVVRLTLSSQQQLEIERLIKEGFRTH